MQQSVNFHDFINAFKAYDRYDQFGYEALRIVFDYLEEYEESTGEELELDVVAICCDYSADHYTDIAANYGLDLEGMEEDEAKDAVIVYIQDNTQFLGLTDDGHLVYQVF